jgi:glutamate formiminotransferase/formiminotetrahydrofolate cyclodeaminase
MKQLIPMIDADTNAFNDYMNAMRLPKNSDEEKKIRKAKMQEGLKKAIDVPLTVMRIADSCWEWMVEMAKYGNLNSSSDLAVGAKNLESGIWGAFKNVEINLPQIEDSGYKEKITSEAKELVDKAGKFVKKVNGILEKRKEEE